MGTYRNIKCGYCSYSFTGGYQLHDGPRVKLGVPYVKCPKCGRLNKTGLKPWSMFTKQQKVFYYLQNVFYATLIGGMLGIAAGAGINSCSGKNNFGDNIGDLLLPFIIGAFIGNLVVLNGNRLEIKNTEEIIKSPEYQSFFKKN